jgi:hypothetical protein
MGSNPEVGPRGPEMAPDHTRAVDLQGCGDRIYEIGAAAWGASSVHNWIGRRRVRDRYYPP